MSARAKPARPKADTPPPVAWTVEVSEVAPGSYRLTLWACQRGLVVGGRPLCTCTDHATADEAERCPEARSAAMVFLD